MDPKQAMSRNAKPRKPYRARPVQSWLPADLRHDIEIMAHFLAPKLAAGMFGDIDGNTLAYMLNIARRIAIEGGYTSMISMVDTTMHAFLGVRQRRERLGKWGAAGEELLVIEESLPNIATWLITQPVHRILAARAWVLKANATMARMGALFAEVSDDLRIENPIMRGAQQI